MLLPLMKKQLLPSNSALLFSLLISNQTRISEIVIYKRFSMKRFIKMLLLFTKNPCPTKSMCLFPF